MNNKQYVEYIELLTKYLEFEISYMEYELQAKYEREALK
jgi:hypothetical protein